MENLIALQQKIAPEFGEVIERRYAILRHVYFSQPVGRRVLASRLRAPERMIRNEIDFLKDRGLLAVDVTGVKVTREGEDILWKLGDYVRLLRGFAHLEGELARALGLARVIVVPGDADEDPTVKKEVGRAAARLLRDIVRDGDIIAVGGGTTMAAVAEAVPASWSRHDVTVVPARGGLGEDVEKQADTIAATMAKRMGGVYRLLNVPDDLPAETMSMIADDPRIREIMDMIKKARIVMHGVGTIEEMARRRNLSREEMEILRSGRAVGETFGYYFNRSGEIVHLTPSMGLRPEDMAGKEVIAVAAGASKAEAIIAVMANRPREGLVCDEGTARKVLEILRQA
ncbi:MAG TPA: hypothetical protein GXX51_10720 [Firmicutes bacterium]|nr:hypothetical protein [Bacillota bacterium]